MDRDYAHKLCTYIEKEKAARGGGSDQPILLDPTWVRIPGTEKFIYQELIRDSNKAKVKTFKWAIDTTEANKAQDKEKLNNLNIFN